MAVTVVTDSTAYLPETVVRDRRLHIVPLTVAVSGLEGREGIDISSADVARALGERRATVTTSRPSPARFAEVYRGVLDGGAEGIVSVHLSSRLSGTYEAAVFAAAEFGDAVAVVDAQSAGMSVGFVALAAADAAAAGGCVAEVADAARATVEHTTTLFYVDTLEFLRRGGRIGAASALVGTALSVKPILRIADGEVLLSDKVRTASRGLARLADLTVEAAGDGAVDIAVQHLGAAPRAMSLLDALIDRLGDRLHARYLVEVGAVVAAHTGPGVIGVALHRHP